MVAKLYPVLDKGRRVAVAELVQGTVNASLGAVGGPARLNGLVAEWPIVAVLHRSEQRPVPRFGFFAVAPEQADELRVVEQHRAPLPALAEDVQVFVVKGQIQTAALLQGAAALLDDDDLQAISPANPKNPNDTRHRLRTVLLEAQALVAWAQGQPASAQAALQAALPLITFAVGAESVEGKQIAAQLARVEFGVGPLI